MIYGYARGSTDGLRVDASAKVLRARTTEGRERA